LHGLGGHAYKNQAMPQPGSKGSNFSESSRRAAADQALIVAFQRS